MAINLTDINTKLVDISTQYSKFNKNQVLTETQLNTFLDYFDDQDRLTRTSLSGVGIVCGFKVIYNSGDHTIQITQGRGVTTDGDLLALQKQSDTEAGQKDSTLKSIDLSSKTYGFYKKFTDNKAKYKHFIKPDNNVIDMWELHEQDADTHTNLSELANISDMVALLYVESYSKEGDLCTQLTCDNQGIEQVARLRVLLVSYQNAQYIIDNDPIFTGNNWYETYLALREVSAKRIILNNSNTKTNADLKKSYLEVFNDTNTIDYLGESLDLIYNKFGQSPVSHLVEQLFDFNEEKIPTDFQYRYDLLKDFIDTYNEIKEVLLDLNVECCPNIGSFPKHLMIGRLVETNEYASFRHSFYKSPIIASENEKYRKVLSLLQKIKELIEQYKPVNKGEEIKITPSLTQATLSEKSIPFYYNVTDSFLEKWSVKTSKYLRKRYNLSYHTENLADVPSVRNPLDYNLDPFDFYRIEGHQGKLYRDALDQINQLKQNKGLSFDVKVLSIETDKESLDLNEHKCHFEDLTVLLDAWRVEQNCVLEEVSQFLSGFSIETPGQNTTTGINDLDKLSEEEIAAAKKRFESEEKMVQVTMQRSKRHQGRANNLPSWLASDEDSIGALMGTIISNNNSISEIQLAIYNAMQGVAQQDSWTQNQDLGSFVLEDIPALLVIIYLLDGRIPESISEMTDESLQEYSEAVSLLCGKVVEMQARYEDLDLSAEIKRFLALLFSRLSSVCCSAKKLEVLYEKVQSRKEHILTQTQLCEFAKNHPGLEHKAGVVPGGTFVMVYLKEAEESEPTYPNVILEIPFLEQPFTGENGVGGDSGKIELWEDRYSPDFTFVGEMEAEGIVPVEQAVQVGETLEQTVENLAAFLNFTWENEGGVGKLEAESNGNILLIHIKDRSVPEESFYMRFENPATVGSDAEFFFEPNGALEANITTKNTVIADFSLPYMCCSDCTPINFIVPAEPVFLSLPASYICLKEGEDVTPIPFTVSPSDGEIKANVDPALPSGVTTDENGNPVFDASLMHESLYGQEISFTVNDEETDCRITVYEDVDLTVTTDAAYDEMYTVATVTFEVSNRYPNLTYSWDFGNGEAYDEMPNEDRIIEKVYDLSLLDTDTIEPSLTVSNGFCEKVVPIDPIVIPTPVSLSLPVPFICLKEGEDVAPIPFMVSPIDGEIKANVDEGIQSGVTTDENGNPVFDPSLMDENLYGEEIRFTVNDEETDCRITVYEDVALTVSTSEVYDEMFTMATVTFEVSNRYPNLTYSWDFGNGEAYDEMPNEDRIVEKVYDLSLLDSNTIEPSLTVSNGFCEKVVTIDPITFEELTEVQLEIIDSICLDISSEAEERISFTAKEPAGAQIEIVGSYDGLFIENDQLVINPVDFEDFNTPISFTLGGQSTNAQITIGFTFTVEIDQLEGTYNWMNNVLHYRYNLQAIIPNSIDLGILNFRWMVGPEHMGVNNNEIQINLPVPRDGGTTDVSVEITSGGPCVSGETIPVGQPYPDFRLRMPEDKLEYCLKGRSYHAITVLPEEIEGTPVVGDGVTYDDNGNPRFRVIDRNTPDVGTVDLSVDGDVLLTLTIKDVPVARFEAVIEGNELVLTNNSSDDGDTYKWNVGGTEVVRDRKQNERISLDQIDGDFINISLVVTNICGEDTFEIQEFPIKRNDTTDENKCVDAVMTQIRAERKKLPPEAEIDVRDLVALSTVRLYDVIIAGTPVIQEKILSGGEITPEFVNGLTSLYENTQIEILESVNNPERITQLSQYLIAQTRYFFLVIHCQPDITFEENKEGIDFVIDTFAEKLGELKAARIQIDKGGSLETSLNNYMADPQVQSFIINDIKNKILPTLRFS